MGGSQLKQLKASLKSHGLIGQTNTGKKSKKTSAASDRKDREQVLQTIRQAFNPFDVKVTHQKLDVINRTVQGAKGKPGISKQVGEENRRRAYEVASKQNKAGGIIDRRFGENDQNMTPEEKMLARFTREKLSGLAKKNSLFNLEDDEDGEEEVLTHYGQSLALDDDFEVDDDDLRAGDDDEESNEILRKRKQLGINNEDDQQGGSSDFVKSKKEVMQEIIAKSKMYKYERQAAKQEDLDVIDELDSKENIDSLLDDLTALDRQIPGEKKIETERDQEYEQHVREMAFDRRAKPSDRTKTEEEQAKEKAEKLRKLEQDRLARMDNELLLEGEEEEEDENNENDLNEDLNSSDEENGNDASEFGLQVKQQQYLSDDYISDDKSDFNSEAEDDEEDEEEEKSDNEQLPAFKKQRITKSATNTTSLFIFKCPQTIIELHEIFSKLSTSEQPTTVERIIDLYHPSLAQGNKQKLAVFSTVLFDYILEITNINGRDSFSSVLDPLITHLRKLSTNSTEELTSFCREKLEEIEQKFAQARVGNELVSSSDLFLFTLIGLLFSTSDHFHLVVTSATLILAQHLSQNPIRSLKDLLIGIYICDTMLAYQRISQLYIPEIPLFLGRLFTLFCPLDIKNEVRKQNIFVEDSDFHYDLNFNKISSLSDGNTANLKLSEITEEPSHPDLGERIFLHAVSTMAKVSNLWRDKVAFIEIFEPLCSVLGEYGDVCPEVNSVTSRIDKLVKFSSNERLPLTLQSHRPLPIQTYAPKFEENYNLDKKSYDSNPDRNETSKLKAELKKERKGALRDLRRDNAFIAREKIKSRRHSDKEYHEKVARLERTIQTEEGTEKNKYEREKQARKRRK